LTAETRHLVDEAAQLLANGRDIEARALVEKAQAIAVPDAHPSNGTTKGTGPVTGEKVEQTIISRVSIRLAQAITTALTEAVDDLHLNFGAQMKEVARSLEDRLTGIASQLQALPLLHERVERIEQDETARARAAQERWEGLSASVVSLQEADHGRRVEAEHFSRSVAVELEMMSARVAAHEERLEALNHFVQDLSLKVLSVVEQIDHQTEALRTMQEHQAQRAAALNAVLDGIAALREPRPLVNEVGAG
jgi:chromosome segregation ATPase